MAFLTHTHGLAGDGPITLRTAYTGQFEDTGDLLGLLARHAPTGSRAFSYSNIGYNVVGFVLEAVAGNDWKTVVQHEVLTPAGMDDTGATLSQFDRARLAKPHGMRVDGTFERLPYGKVDATMHAAGGHVATLGDLGRWITLHMNGGTIDGRRVFPETVVRNTHRLHVPQDRDFAFLHRVGWGIGWDIGTYEGDTIVHRHGGYNGARSHVSFSPAHRIGVVAQVNAATGSPATDLIASYAYDLAARRPDADARANANLERLTESLERTRAAIREDRERRAARQINLPHPLTDYAGAFENDALGRVVWSVVDDGLRVQWGAMEGPAEMYDAASNQLRIELFGNGQVVDFVFEGDGPAVALRTFGETFRRVGG
jgi:CubicO group peptidase (beta-lactamase class C family)